MKQNKTKHHNLTINPDNFFLQGNPGFHPHPLYNIRENVNQLCVSETKENLLQTCASSLFLRKEDRTWPFPHPAHKKNEVMSCQKNKCTFFPSKKSPKVILCCGISPHPALSKGFCLFICSISAHTQIKNSSSSPTHNCEHPDMSFTLLGRDLGFVLAWEVNNYSTINY